MNKATEASLLKTLLDWCKQITFGYQNVNVTNFTSSWRNGLAFCALMHRFNPALIDFASLSKDNVLENNRLAFEAGETLGIPALLDPEDMIVMPIPDKIAVVTYLSTAYCRLKDRKPIGGPNIATKNAPRRPSVIPTRRPSKVVIEKEGVVEVMDICEFCNERVHLIERYWIGPHLYHRTCYMKNSAQLSRMSISQDGTVLQLAGAMSTPGETELRLEAMRRNSSLLSEMDKRSPAVVAGSLSTISEPSSGMVDEPLRLNFRVNPSQVNTPKVNPRQLQPIGTTTYQQVVEPPPPISQVKVQQPGFQGQQVPVMRPTPQVQPIRAQQVPSTMVRQAVLEQAPLRAQQPTIVPKPISDQGQTRPTFIQRVPIVAKPAPVIKVAEPPVAPITTPAPVVKVPEPPPPAIDVTATKSEPECEPDNSVMSGDTTSFTKSDSFKRRTAKPIAAQFDQKQRGPVVPAATSIKPGPIPANEPAGPLVVAVPSSGGDSMSITSSSITGSTPSPAPSDVSGSGEKPKKHHHKHHHHHHKDGTEKEHKHKHKHRHSKEKEESGLLSETTLPSTPASTTSPSPSSSSGSTAKDTPEQLLLTPPSSSSASSIVSQTAIRNPQPVKQPQFIMKLPPKPAATTTTTATKTLIAPPVSQPAVISTTTSTTAPISPRKMRLSTTRAQRSSFGEADVKPGPHAMSPLSPENGDTLFFSGKLNTSTTTRVDEPSTRSQGLLMAVPKIPSKEPSAVPTTVQSNKPSSVEFQETEKKLSTVKVDDLPKVPAIKSPTPPEPTTVPTTVQGNKPSSVKFQESPVVKVDELPKIPTIPTTVPSAKFQEPLKPKSQQILTEPLQEPPKLAEPLPPAPSFSGRESFSKKDQHVRFSETVDLVHIERHLSESSQQSQQSDEEVSKEPPKSMTKVVKFSEELDLPSDDDDEDVEEEEEEDNPFMTDLVGKPDLIKIPTKKVSDDVDMFGDEVAKRISDDEEVDEDELAAMAKRLQSFAAKFEQTPGRSILKQATSTPTKTAAPPSKENPFDEGNDDDDDGDDDILHENEVPLPSMLRARDSIVPARLKKEAKKLAGEEDEEVPLPSMLRARDSIVPTRVNKKQVAEDDDFLPPSRAKDSIAPIRKKLVSEDANPFADEETEKGEANPFASPEVGDREQEEDANPFAEEVKVERKVVEEEANPFAENETKPEVKPEKRVVSSNDNPFSDEITENGDSNPFADEVVSGSVEEANPFASEVAGDENPFASESSSNPFGSEPGPEEDNPFSEGGGSSSSGARKANPFVEEPMSEKPSSEPVENPFNEASKRKANFSSGVKRVIPKPKKIEPENAETSAEPVKKKPENEESVAKSASGRPLRTIHIDLAESEELSLKRRETTDNLERAKADEFEVELRLDAVRQRLQELEQQGVVLETKMRADHSENLQAMSEFVLVVNERDRLVSEEFQLIMRKELRELEARQKVVEYQLKELADREESMNPAARKAIKGIRYNVEQELVQIIAERNQKTILLEESKQNLKEQIQAFDTLVSSEGNDSNNNGGPRLSEPGGLAQTFKRLVSRASHT